MSGDDVMPSTAQVEAAEAGRATHPGEPHSSGSAGRLNWLRAGVLGANDGIVSVAGIVIGVAGATASRGPIFTAGLAAHLDAELHIDPADIPSPVQAAGASALSFTSGAVLPMPAILLPPPTCGDRLLSPPS